MYLLLKWGADEAALEPNGRIPANLLDIEASRGPLLFARRNQARASTAVPCSGLSGVASLRLAGGAPCTRFEGENR